MNLGNCLPHPCMEQNGIAQFLVPLVYKFYKVMIMQCQHKVCSAYRLFLTGKILESCFVTSCILVDLFVKLEKIHVIK